VRILEKDRRDFYLYVDEFQNFVTDSFASILSEARKYRLSLIVAHQYIAQLIANGSTQVKDAVFGNVGTLIVFRCGAEDAEFLEKEFQPQFMATDLVNIPNYNICLRLMIDGVMREPFSAQVLPPIQLPGTEKHKEKVIQHSRERHGVKRKEVETKINRWSGIMDEGDVSEEELRKIVLAAPNPTPVPKKKEMYQAVCVRCGKTALVPFKPKEGLPVYCDNCLKIVKGKGEAPLKDRKDVDFSGLKDILGKAKEK
jgi:CxxC-x17-CxxC domain-containing protein